jgi:hypothetical protein
MWSRVVVLFVSCVWLPVVASSHVSAQPQGPSTLPAPDDLPIRAEYHYRLSGSARPFLFWINRDNVGAGRMTWRRAADGTLSLELLMGSDPARAPFKTNRWGYIREVVRGDSAELVAVKTETEEETIEDAKASVNRQDQARSLLFVHEYVTPRDARASTAVVDLGLDASYRELDTVLDRMSAIREWHERVGSRPHASRPGFLVALTELMQSGVDAWRATISSSFTYGTQTLTYIHRAKPYELRQSDVEVLRDVTLGGGHYSQLLRGTFRIRNPATNYRSQFVVIYGVDDRLAAVPVRITYQPRWWLRTQLTLDPSAQAARSRAGRSVAGEAVIERRN